MNQKTVRQLKKFARENKIDFHRVKNRWESTPWFNRHAFRQEVCGQVTNVATAKQKAKVQPAKARKVRKAG